MAFAEVQEFVIECPGCDGTGKPKHSVTGANRCMNCQGEGAKTVRLPIPKPGSKVKVKYGLEQLLLDMFGVHQSGPKRGLPKVTTDSVGIVHDVQSPEQHLLELRTGVGVRVNFAGELTQQGRIPKGRTVDLWTFDLYELRFE